MHVMNPMFADAIDFPLVLGFGLIVLVPLLLFEVVVEAFVLKAAWSIPFGKLCRYTFVANILSLLAGIPVKILNAWLYSFLLPQDLPGFFARYPSAVALGSFIYFIVTVGVEGAYAFRWLRRHQYSIGRWRIWTGALLANLATYIVLAPLHYYFTRPLPEQIREFTPTTKWTGHPEVKVIFTDAVNGYLKTVQLDGSASETIVPRSVKDYLVSADLNLCLFRGTNGTLWLYNRKSAHCDLILQTSERFQMDQVAFSPSGHYVAFASESSVFARESGSTIEAINVLTGQRASQPLAQNFDFQSASVAWSTNETEFYIAGFENNGRESITIQHSGRLDLKRLTGTNAPPVFCCYGRIGKGAWYGGDDWGRAFNTDSCGDLSAYTEPGLDSHLRICRGSAWQKPILILSVNPGLIHIARFVFGDVAFLTDCNECLFDANGCIYLLDIQNKTVGTVVHGERFILLTPRYQKL
jgi:hypothetical protein